MAQSKGSNLHISFQNQANLNSLPQDPFNLNQNFQTQNFKIPIQNQSSLIYCNHYPEISNLENQINTEDIHIIMPDQALLDLQKKNTNIQIFKDLKADPIYLEHFSEEKKKESEKNNPRHTLTKSRILNTKFQNSSNLLDIKSKIDERTRKMNRLKIFFEKKTRVNSLHPKKFNKNQLKLSCFQYFIFNLCNIFSLKKISSTSTDFKSREGL